MFLQRINKWLIALPGTLIYNSTHYLVSWIFLRGLALIYFSAFASMAVQIPGLIGENGILPIQLALREIVQIFPGSKFSMFPTVFWLNASDQALMTFCFAGMAAAIVLLLGVFDRIALIICYCLYLSISVAGQDFTAFQWDIFLLEAGFLGIFLTWGSEIIVFFIPLFVCPVNVYGRRCQAGQRRPFLVKYDGIKLSLPNPAFTLAAGLLRLLFSNPAE